MAETETKIKVTADARDLKAIERGMREAFNPMSARSVKRETQDLQRELKGLTAAQVQLSKAMRDVEKGSDAYKRLKKDIKEVKEQASSVHGVLGQINKAYGDMDRRAQRRRSFIGGVAQGAGVAQYMPAERGMYGRMAGAMVGGAVRRGVGAAAAPFTMPGMGGLSAMMGAMPLVGGFAQGALQTASGLYQQYVGHQRARMPNIYWAGGPTPFERAARMRQGVGGGGMDPEAAENLRTAEEEYQKSRLEQERWGKQERIFAKVRTRRSMRMSKQEVQDARELNRWINESQSPEATRARNMRRTQDIVDKMGVQGGTGGYGRAIGGGGFGSPSSSGAGIQRKIDVEVSAANAKTARAREAFEDAKAEATASQRRSRYRAFIQAAGGMGQGRRMFQAGFGTEFGYDPGQVQGMLGQYMGARGGVATRQAQVGAREAMAAQLAFGVQMGTSGQFARMGMGGGGGTNFGTGIAGILQQALELGLRGSQIPEYLQSLVSQGQQAEKSGVKLDVRQFTKSAEVMRELGLEGPRIGATTAQFAQSSRTLAAQGVQSAAQLVMLRAHGFKPGGGPESYAKAILKAESGEGAGDALVNLIAMTAQGAKGFVGETPEGTRAMRAVRFMRGMSGYGMQIGGGEATMMLDKMYSTKDPEEYKAWLHGVVKQLGIGPESEAPVARGALRLGARTMARGAVPGAVSAAQLQAERIGAGGKMGSTFVALERVGIQSARVLGEFNGQIKTVVGWMQSALNTAGKLAQGDLLKALKDLVTGGGMPKGGKRKKVGGNR